MLADAVTLIGHASYFASLQIRNFLNLIFLLRISLFVVNLIQSLHFCSAMNYPNISRILAKWIRFQGVGTTRRYIPEYKSNYNQQFGRRGRRGPFLGSRGYNRHQYQDRKGNNAATSVKNFKAQTDRAWIRYLKLMQKTCSIILKTGVNSPVILGYWKP